MKVLVLDMPRLMREIVEGTISKQLDMDLVTPGQSTMRVEPVEPDIAVVGTREPGDAARPNALLRQWPRSHVVMLALSGRDAALYSLRPHKTPLGEVSPTRLIEIMRSAFADRNN